MKCRIAIVGGGLAGLATAQALATFGLSADIFEAAPVLGEIGAAVSTSPQANKALQAIGLGEKIAAIGDHFQGLYTRNMQTGEFLEFRDPKDVEARFGAPSYTFHRADLLDALAEGLDADSIHLGHRLTRLEERDDSVGLTFANGATVQADIVIGADGVRSATRGALYGEDHPTYTGQMAWRALLKGGDVPPECLQPNGRIQWMGPGCHFIAYYIRHGQIVNIVTQQDTEQWVDEGWSSAGDPAEMRASFPNPEPRLATLLNLVTTCSKWGLFMRPLTNNWGRGRIQLIGDAAHAMLPNIGQGACQAFEDAYILARWLDADRGNPIAAFQNFRRVRIPRVQGVQRLAASTARFKHMNDPAQQKALIDSGRGGSHFNIDWVLSFDPISEWDRDPVMPPEESHA